MLVFMKYLDRKTRSSLEQTCKILCSISRAERPHLQQLTLEFSTTWNLEQYAEITAIFAPDFIFHASFKYEKKKDPMWIRGGWSSERQETITSGTFPPEKLRLNATFESRTSRYIEYWLKNFQIDVLKVKVENKIPGKERDFQQTNYMGQVPVLRLKKFILQGSNNIRFITNWLNSMIPNDPDPIDSSRKTMEIELFNVEKLEHIFHHPIMASGKVRLSFQRNGCYFKPITLSTLNVVDCDIIARQVPSEAVNIFLKRWTRGEMTEDFQYLHICETTQWMSQEIEMKDALKGLRYQTVQITTDLELKVLQLQKCYTDASHSNSSLPSSSSESSSLTPPPKIYQITGPRPAFCIQCDGEFIFEVPRIADLEKITTVPPMIQNTFDEYERQKNRIYMELFRKKLIRFFN